MPAEALQWDSLTLISENAATGGLVHYFNEFAQELYLSEGGMSTRILRTSEGRYGTLQDERELNPGSGFGGFALDHPSFGILFGSWAQEGEAVVSLYVYAADIGELLRSAELQEQADNPQKGLSLTLRNARPDLFDNDMCLMQPGAAIELSLFMGASGPFPMGRYYLDTGSYDPFAESQSFKGRSRVGRLLKDAAFDTGDGGGEAVFSGSPEAIVRALFAEYAPAVESWEIIVQHDGGTYTARFEPRTRVLEGLTEWLRSYREPDRKDMPVLRRGDHGEDVKTAQRLLNGHLSPGMAALVIDGSFGAKTETAVRSYQRAKALQTDGVIGPEAWAALLGGQPEATWELAELYDGRFIIGDADFIARFRPVSRYTMDKNIDIFTRKISRSADGAYSRIGVRYRVKTEEGTEDRYVYAVVPSWAAWALPSHKTLYIDAPEGSTQTQARELADKSAVLYQYVGVTETANGPIRPQLLVGDIAQIKDGDTGAEILGVVTEVRHRMGEAGFTTQFTYTSGGSIMEREEAEAPGGTETEPVKVVTTWGQVQSGANRRSRMVDVIQDVARREARGGAGYPAIPHKEIN